MVSNKREGNVNFLDADILHHVKLLRTAKKELSFLPFPVDLHLRDVRELTKIGDEVKFTRFMMVMAARTGQLLNLNSVANEVGISQPTLITNFCQFTHVSFNIGSDICAIKHLPVKFRI